MTLTAISQTGRRVLSIDRDATFFNVDSVTFDNRRAGTLAAQHLIRTRTTAGGEAVETCHDRIAQAAVALLPEDELRDMHAVLGLALEGFAGADAGLVADHFLAAGMVDRAAKYADARLPRPSGAKPVECGGGPPLSHSRE